MPILLYQIWHETRSIIVFIIDKWILQKLSQKPLAGRKNEKEMKKQIKHVQLLGELIKEFVMNG